MTQFSTELKDGNVLDGRTSELMAFSCLVDVWSQGKVRLLSNGYLFFKRMIGQNTGNPRMMRNARKNCETFVGSQKFFVKPSYAAYLLRGKLPEFDVIMVFAVGSSLIGDVCHSVVTVFKKTDEGRLLLV